MFMKRRQTMAKVVVKHSSHFQQLKNLFFQRKEELVVVLFYLGYIGVVAYCFSNGIELPEITGFE